MSNICELAEKHKCTKYLELGGCYVYDEYGVGLRNRLGYCPVGDVPKKNVVKKDTRVGQQKQKKRT